MIKVTKQTFCTAEEVKSSFSFIFNNKVYEFFSIENLEEFIGGLKNDTNN